MNEDLLIMSLRIGETNAALEDWIKKAHRARTEGGFGHVVATVSGFNDDQRELYEIPEVRAFCRRLCTCGLISCLDVSTTSEVFGAHPGLEKAFGAFEVWLVAEGKMRRVTAVDADDAVEFQEALERSNERCNRVLGD